MSKENINLEKLFQEVMMILNTTPKGKEQSKCLKHLTVEIVFPENFQSSNHFTTNYKGMSLQSFWKTKKKIKGKLYKGASGKYAGYDNGYDKAKQYFPETLKLIEYGIEQKNKGVK